ARDDVARQSLVARPLDQLHQPHASPQHDVCPPRASEPPPHAQQRPRDAHVASPLMIISAERFPTPQTHAESRPAADREGRPSRPGNERVFTSTSPRGKFPFSAARSFLPARDSVAPRRRRGAGRRPRTGRPAPAADPARFGSPAPESPSDG